MHIFSSFFFAESLVLPTEFHDWQQQKTKGQITPALFRNDGYFYHIYKPGHSTYPYLFISVFWLHSVWGYVLCLHYGLTVFYRFSSTCNEYRFKIFVRFRMKIMYSYRKQKGLSNRSSVFKN